MHRFLVITLAVILTSAALPSRAAAQDEGGACDTPEVQQFDFWIGRWALTWGEDGRGTNAVRRILNDCVIEERFEGQMPEGRYRGRSVSAYDPERDVWLQTWVDDRGNYLDFSGGVEDGRMVLRREAVKDGQPVVQRMVWYNISEHELDWNWEQSEDGGATWTTLWTIHYTRQE